MVWHTQGSGKSLTMVMFVKALISSEDIINPRILVVTDRLDLNQQIKDTFRDCNIKKDVSEATTGADLIKKIKDKNTDVITTLVGRFETATKSDKIKDEDKNIFILIDEAHRSHGGIASLKIEEILPNACKIGFTGTPLMKGEKSIKRFGDYIDKYTIKEATEDGAVLPLVYEGRFVNQELQGTMVDKYYERITSELNDSQKKDLQKKFNSKKMLEETKSRIEAIAIDIYDHYTKYFQGTGLKAQLVAPSKYCAILFKKALDTLGKIKTEVIISDENNIEDDDEKSEHKQIVEEYLKNIKDIHGELGKREKNIIKDFKKNPDGCEIIIVVSKLLTGFDAPRNTILYLAKELKDHTLLQAIARVNRVFDGDTNKPSKVNGFIIDYSKNAENIKKAMDLFSNYNEDEIENALMGTDEKIKELRDSYQSVLEIFKHIKNKDDNDE